MTGGKRKARLCPFPTPPPAQYKWRPETEIGLCYGLDNLLTRCVCVDEPEPDVVGVVGDGG